MRTGVSPAVIPHIQISGFNVQPVTRRFCVQAALDQLGLKGECPSLVLVKLFLICMKNVESV